MDYAEEFDQGIKCFGCNKFERFDIQPGKNRSKKPTEMNVFYYWLEEKDYNFLYTKWGILSKQANDYGIHKAFAKDNPLKTWLVFPVYDNRGQQLLVQFRAYEGEHKNRFYSCRVGSEMIDGIMWYSWYKGETIPVFADSAYVGIVEGIPDGIRLGEVIPTVALIGSTPDDAKIQALLTLPAKYAIILDNDATNSAYKLQKKLGVDRAKVILLESGDPADYTKEQLTKMIGEVIK
jgi:hypothetical protein